MVYLTQKNWCFVFGDLMFIFYQFKWFHRVKCICVYLSGILWKPAIQSIILYISISKELVLIKTNHPQNWRTYGTVILCTHRYCTACRRLLCTLLYFCLEFYFYFVPLLLSIILSSSLYTETKKPEEVSTNCPSITVKSKSPFRFHGIENQTKQWVNFSHPKCSVNCMWLYESNTVP